MQEEANMEKKTSCRSTSVVPQKNGCDARKQDNGSKFGKQPRRREGSGSRTRQDNSSTPPRKPLPQKFRSYDKRPRSRGYYNDGPREEVIPDAGAELGSALMQGSKKGNLNHLLNFTFAPRDVPPPHQQWKGRNNWSRGKVRYNKEQFLQASCQFIVSDRGDYTVNAVDPDKLVDWDLIEKVHIFSHEVPSCPICLYHPVAAKLTRCGHIYCWSCILHYLSLGDKSWRKCPICNEAIEKKQLKSVMALPNHQYSVGEEITMKLMKRERGSTYAVPKSQWTTRNGKPHKVKDPVDRGYLKLLVASNDDVRDIVQSERSELNQQLKEETDSLTVSFIEHALELLDERERTLNADGQVEANVTERLEQLKVTENTVESPSEQYRQPRYSKPIVQYASAFSDEEVDLESKEEEEALGCHDDADTLQSSLACESAVSDDTPVHSHAVHLTDGDETLCANEMTVDQAAQELQLPPQARLNKMTDNYYFYQACDGQHIYLNSLNARCLAREYGSLEHGPEMISARIVELEGVTMNEELRQRLRYLSHLPVTCTFTVAELELKPPLLSKGTIQHFSGEIDKRRRQRQRKARDERRRFKQWEEKENSRLRVPLQSRQHFPQCSASTGSSIDAPTTTPTSSPSTAPSNPIDTPLTLNPNASEFIPGPVSPVSTASSDSSGGYQWGAPISFAQMLQQGKAKPDAWPKGRTSAPPSGVKARRSESDGSDCEDKVPVPEYQAAFGDAIQEALEKMNNSPGAVTEAGSGSRKKKGKQKLLFSTSMSRSK